MFQHDLRYAIRSLGRDRVITLGIVLCLATGMGATSAIFTVLNEALLKPLPFGEADRLTILYDTQRSPDGTEREYPVSPANFDAWRRMNQTFDEIAASAPRDVNLTGAGEPMRLPAAEVVANFFSTLGVEPILGRTFSPGEDQLGGVAPAVVISYGLWQRRFGGDPAIVDQPILLNDHSYTVIGIMPKGFGFPEGLEGYEARDVWMPLGVDPHLGGYHFLFVVGRLRADIPLAKAQGDMDVIAEYLVREFPETNNGFGVRVVPMQEALVGSDLRLALLRLWMGVCFLLAIACINVAGILLARATTRSGETALRTALGCSRGRLLRLLLTESVSLALLGAAGSFLLTWLIVPPLIGLSGLTVPAFRGMTVEWSVLGFNLVVAVIAGILFGLVPALKLLGTSRPDELLNGSTRAGTSRWGRRFHAGLVVGEIGLSLVLLVGAGLMIKSFYRLQQVDPGFRTENLLTMRLYLSPVRYQDQQQRNAFIERILTEIRSLPGAESATACSVLPIGDLDMGSMFEVRDRVPAEPNEVLITYHRAVGSRFFETADLPIVEGRPFNVNDHADSPMVVIVSRHMAREYWPGTSPLGRQVKQAGPEPWFTVVGVAEDVHDSALDAKTGSTWYRPYSQHSDELYRLVIGTASEPLSLVPEVRRAIWSVDPNQAFYDVRTAAEMVSDSLARERFSTVLLCIFAAMGLILASLGIYGLMSYSVNQRTAEVGIRMALGADRGRVRWMILRWGATLTAIGLAIGLIFSVIVNRLFTSLLFDVGPSDPPTVAAMVVFLAAVALLATYLPARRASRIEPAESLKSL